MPGVFDETMRLLMDAQEYFYISAIEDVHDLRPETKLVYTTEMSRITLRLSSIMAWLMVRRAVFSGKISAEEAATRYRLEYPDTCLTETPYAEALLPHGMCELLDKSHELYLRVHRLDGQSAVTVH